MTDRSPPDAVLDVLREVIRRFHDEGKRDGVTVFFTDTGLADRAREVWAKLEAVGATVREPTSTTSTMNICGEYGLGIVCGFAPHHDGLHSWQPPSPVPRARYAIRLRRTTGDVLWAGSRDGDGGGWVEALDTATIFTGAELLGWRGPGWRGSGVEPVLVRQTSPRWELIPTFTEEL